MSHYTVLVVGNNIEGMLEPYDESLEIENPEGTIVEQDDIDRFKNWYLSEERIEEGDDKLTFEELYAKYGYSWNDNQWKFEGDEVLEYSTYNPNSKWDWYQIGGRWRGMLKLKEGKQGKLGDASWMNRDSELPSNVCDSALVGDIDWEAMFDKDEYEKSKRFYEIYVNGDTPKNDEERKMVERVFYKKEYYQETYGNAELYAKCNASFSTYAILDEHGWHEPGQMGWWGMSSETPEEKLNFELEFAKYLENLSDDERITVVDCHI